ncbi:MAG: tyrosine-type recombinase/integrase [Beduini sp.]|uniref:tyrosine-type recombinase/integrase n=2 Tax=Beduini sp. TaxID=1922300 RepID=UPI0011C7AEFB
MKKTILNLKTVGNFKKYLYEEERSEATISKYMRDITGFYEFLPEDKIVTKEAVIAYKQSLADTYKPTSINSMLVAVNGLLAYMGLNDCKVKLQKIQKRIFHDENNLSKQEYQRLLAAAESKSNEQLLMLMQTICATGIRVSEHKYVTVEALKQGSAVVKNKGKIREIIFPKKLRRSLLKYCKEHHIESGAVFITKHGNPLDRSNIWTMMKSLCDEAGVDKAKVFPHNLRHLFAYTFYGLEKDLVRLADILGHSSIETTRIYTKTGMKKCQSIMDRMDLLSKNSTQLATT